ncbi:MAG: hypothetical protein M3280_01130 [Actinomycetota bacterium]|nr:hypothetical protein [Actinomycetota bacterium]
MHARPFLLVVALSMLLPACRPETVDLVYRFPEGSTLRYELVSAVKASWDLEGREPDEGSYRVAFDLTETVESADQDGAIVSLDLTRTSVEEDNFPPPDSSSMTVGVATNGSVVEIVEVDDVPAGFIEPERRSIIRTYRPQLAAEPVRLYQEWPAEQGFQGPESEQVSLVGKLEGLDTDDQGDFAKLRFRGSGPLIGTAEVAEDTADLDGELRTNIEAMIDLEEGVLRSSSSITTYDFDVSVTPQDATNPITGTLHIEETLELRRV